MPYSRVQDVQMPPWAEVQPPAPARLSGVGTFRFVEPGPLCDGELELVEPAESWIDAYMAAHRHPRSLAEVPQMARVTRGQVVEWLSRQPRGRRRSPNDGGEETCAAYTFWMHPREEAGAPDGSAAMIAGSITLRIGDAADLRLYLGHLGYSVFPAMRGRHYAERACRLLLPLARRYGISPLWITCNPENQASRRTCQRLGAALVDVVPVPVDHPLYARGDHAKCRYRLAL